MSKSLETIFFPHQFNAFPQVSDKQEGDHQWQVNRPWVLANMAHVAYFNSTQIGQLMATFGVDGIFFYDNDGRSDDSPPNRCAGAVGHGTQK